MLSFVLLGLGLFFIYIFWRVTILCVSWAVRRQVTTLYSSRYSLVFVIYLFIYYSHLFSVGVLVILRILRDHFTSQVEFKPLNLTLPSPESLIIFKHLLLVWMFVVIWRSCSKIKGEVSWRLWDPHELAQGRGDSDKLFEYASPCPQWLGTHIIQLEVKVERMSIKRSRG